MFTAEVNKIISECVVAVKIFEAGCVKNRQTRLISLCVCKVGSVLACVKKPSSINGTVLTG